VCREVAWTELAVLVTLVVAFQSWSRGKKDDVMAEDISAIFRLYLFLFYIKSVKSAKM